MYEYIVEKLPKRLTDHYKQLLSFAGKERGKTRYIGFAFLGGLAVSFVATLLLYFILHLSAMDFIIYFVVVYLFVEAVIYARLMIAADNRSRHVERVLPDALQLIAINMRSGLTIDRALLSSAQKEFGPLEERISYAGKKIVAGKSVKYAFLEIPENIKSDMLKKNIELIVEGLESGGELANLLLETSEDIRNARTIEAEIKSVVLTYAIFIFFAAAIGAPLIFGISTYLVDTLSAKSSDFNFDQTISSESVNVNFMSANAASIEPAFLQFYAIASLIITSFFSSLIIGLIKDGSEKRGLKYMPIMIALSLVIFFGTRWFVAHTFQI